MTDNTIDLSVDELESLLKAKKDELAAAEKARRESVKPVWSWVLKRDDNAHRMDRLMDDSCVWYRLIGYMRNVTEYEAVHGGDSISNATRTGHGQGMTYLYNTLSGRFVLASGGGRIWIKESAWSIGDNIAEIRRNHDECFTELAAFVQANPDGGDVTDIIKSHRGG
jgi:hypothetical protein